MIDDRRVVGPSRFELELLTPQARRIPSYPTGPHINGLLDTPNTQWYLYLYTGPCHARDTDMQKRDNVIRHYDR